MRSLTKESSERTTVRIITASSVKWRRPLRTITIYAVIKTLFRSKNILYRTKISMIYIALSMYTYESIIYYWALCFRQFQKLIERTIIKIGLINCNNLKSQRRTFSRHHWFNHYFKMLTFIHNTLLRLILVFVNDLFSTSSTEDTSSTFFEGFEILREF